MNSLLIIFAVSLTAILFLWIGFEIGYKMGSSTVSFDKRKQSKKSIVNGLMEIILDNPISAIAYWLMFIILMVITTVKTNSIISIILIALGFIFITVIIGVLSKK